MAVETKTKQKTTQSNQNDWKSIVQVFVTNMLERVGENVSKRIDIFVIKLKKRTLGASLIFIGFIFLLVGVALFINALFSEISPWFGWAMSGLVVMFAGYVVSKD